MKEQKFLASKQKAKYAVFRVDEHLRFNVAVSCVVGMDGAQALQGGCGVRDAGRATNVLHPFHMTDAPLEYTAKESQLLLIFLLYYIVIFKQSECH